MEKMEDSIGGGRQGLIYSVADYEKFARQYDAEVEAELASMEANMKVINASYFMMSLMDVSRGHASLWHISKAIKYKSMRTFVRHSYLRGEIMQYI